MKRFWFKLKKALMLCSKPLFFRGVLMGVAATVEHQQALRDIKKCKFVIDAGANKGQFALLAKAMWPNSRVVCFEPLPDPIKQLRSVADLTKGVEIVPLALEVMAQKKTMFVTERLDSSSMLEPQKDVEHGISRECQRTEVVETETLDAWIKRTGEKRVDLLKLDLQGGELNALKGAEYTLVSTRYVFCELSFFENYVMQPNCSEVIAWLYQRGFKLVGVTPCAAATVPWEADFLFQNTNSAKG